MQYQDLRDFLRQLDELTQIKKIQIPVSPNLEMTEISDRVLRAGGPALLFENPALGEKRFDIPALTNLFGTVRRVALGMG